MTEALNHYLDQRDKDFENQEGMMTEKTMIAGAKKWADRCETHSRGEVRNGVIYVSYLLCKLAKLEAELGDFRDRRDEKFQMYEDCKAENEALREFIDVVRKNDYWPEWCKLEALLKEKQE